MLNNENANPLSLQQKVRCYGSSAALTVEATSLLVKRVEAGHTVNLDVAPRLGEEVIWDRKITFQLSETELPIMAGLCLGYLPKAVFKRPGKGLELNRQAGKIFLSATQGSGAVYALPIPIGSTFLISGLLLLQIQRHTSLTGELVIAALRGACALYKGSAK
jgi:hypothetical protein